MATYYLCSGFGPEHSFVNKFGEMLANDLKLHKSLVMIPLRSLFISVLIG